MDWTQQLQHAWRHVIPTPHVLQINRREDTETTIVRVQITVSSLQEVSDNQLTHSKSPAELIVGHAVEAKKHLIKQLWAVLAQLEDEG